jgi:cohesin loading factor subunit SCC2
MQSHGGPSPRLPGFVLISLKVGSLDDVKTNQSDTGAARSMALDHLGVIASRLRSTSLKFGSRSSTESSENRILKSIDEVLCSLPSWAKFRL